MKARAGTGFTLVELLIVIAIFGVLAALIVGASQAAQKAAFRADSTAKLRNVSQAVIGYTGDHDGQFPGPLWPGQILTYDPATNGRIVNVLSSYLGLPESPTPYVVDAMIPRAFRKALPGADWKNIRVYVMNSLTTNGTETNRPFGSLTTSPVLPPGRLSSVDGTAIEERWMMSETDQQQSDVVSAPWKASTPAKPVHGNARARVRFDGGVEFQKLVP